MDLDSEEWGVFWHLNDIWKGQMWLLDQIRSPNRDNMCFFAAGDVCYDPKRDCKFRCGKGYQMKVQMFHVVIL